MHPYIITYDYVSMDWGFGFLKELVAATCARQRATLHKLLDSDWLELLPKLACQQSVDNLPASLSVFFVLYILTSSQKIRVYTLTIINPHQHD